MRRPQDENWHILWHGGDGGFLLHVNSRKDPAAASTVFTLRPFRSPQNSTRLPANGPAEASFEDVNAEISPQARGGGVCSGLPGQSEASRCSRRLWAELSSGLEQSEQSSSRESCWEVTTTLKQTRKGFRNEDLDSISPPVFARRGG